MASLLSTHFNKFLCAKICTYVYVIFFNACGIENAQIFFKITTFWIFWHFIAILLSSLYPSTNPPSKKKKGAGNILIWRSVGYRPSHSTKIVWKRTPYIRWSEEWWFTNKCTEVRVEILWWYKAKDSTEWGLVILLLLYLFQTTFVLPRSIWYPFWFDRYKRWRTYCRKLGRIFFLGWATLFCLDWDSWIFYLMMNVSSWKACKIISWIL